MTAPTTIAPRRGPRVADETVPEQVEGHIYGILTELAHARTALRERFPSHDAAADAAVASVVRIAQERLVRHADPAVRLTARAILAFCADYATHDEAEDAEVAAGASRVEWAQLDGRQATGLIELHATGRQRGRLPRRATRAAQPGLLEVTP